MPDEPAAQSPGPESPPSVPPAAAPPLPAASGRRWSKYLPAVVLAITGLALFVVGDVVVSATSGRCSDSI